MTDSGGMVLIGLAAVAIGMVAWLVVELIRWHRARLEYERALEKWKPE